MNSSSLQKFWTVIQYEYRYTVFCWRFWTMIIVMPLLLLLMVVVMTITLAFTFSRNDPVGVVDYAGAVSEYIAQEKNKLASSFVLYANEETARRALDAKEIQAYYVLPADFFKNKEVRLVYEKRPWLGVLNGFENLVKQSLLKDVPKERAERIAGSILVIPHLVGEGEDSLSGALRLVFPIVAGYFMFMIVSSCSDFIFHAFSEEKANRTLEILVTSVSPDHLLTGKMIALSAAGLTQLALSYGPLLCLLPVLMLISLRVPLVGSVFSWQNMLVFALMAVPSIVLLISLITSMVVTIIEATEASLSSLLLLFSQMLPLAMVSIITKYPDGWISSILTYFPLTSAVTVAVRQGYANIQAWQIGLAFLVLVGASIVSFRLAIKLFRGNVLNIRRKISWKTLPGALYRRIRRYA